MLEFTPDQAESLIEKHRQELHRFLMHRVSCTETANDLLQDIFLRLVTLKSNEPIQNPRAFIYRIAANLATDYLRQKRMMVDVTAAECRDLVDEGAEPETIVFGQQQIGLCEQALSELSPLSLKILMMSRFEGYTHKQIADELGISVSWVEKNIMAALKQCKRALNNQ